jgi:putative DNA primase/helicase
MTATKDTVARARGRWREILPALGIETAVLNGKNQPCPLCGGKDRFRFTNRNDEGVYFCGQCGAGSGLQLLQRFHGWDFSRAAHEVDRIIGNLPSPSTEFYTTRSANPGACRRLYEASGPVIGADPVAVYLASRGLSGPWPKALRHIPELRHNVSGTRQHGMLAVFCDASGKPATIHRTFLTGAGRKAEVEPVRMFMPGHVPNGGAIRLYPEAEMMGIAEGIETAMSAAALFGMPVWATTSANMMEQWQPPEIAKHVTIFADNDLNYVGQCAGYTLAKRLVHEAQRDRIERTVNVMVAPRAGSDWNDHIEKEQADAA